MGLTENIVLLIHWSIIIVLIESPISGVYIIHNFQTDPDVPF